MNSSFFDTIAFAKFLVVGSFNTLLGFLFFWILLDFLVLSPILANSLVYFTGFILSFASQKYFVFKDAQPNFFVVQLLNFTLCYWAAFALNLLILNICLNAALNVYLAQFFSMSVFVICSFLLNRLFVFKNSKGEKN